MKVTINGSTIAQSDETIEIEGNLYFPPQSLTENILKKSETPYFCPWKGECQYFNLEVNSKSFKDAAWTYPKIKAGAIERIGKDFTGYIAFDKSQVEIRK